MGFIAMNPTGQLYTVLSTLRVATSNLIPADTWSDDKVIIALKRCRNVVFT